YVNTGVAIADFDSVSVGASDPSHYYGAEPGILVERLTNGVDADLPPGPHVLEGDPVDWTYEVTNTGNDRLTNILLTDDQLGIITCPSMQLEPRESMVCSASDTATLGQYTNLATVSGQDAPGTVVRGTDPSHYFGYVSEIRLEKSTNGQDADVPTGPAIAVGDIVTWDYVLTNQGNTDIHVGSLTDDKGVVPLFLDGDSNGDNLLNVDETWTYQAQGVAVAGQYTNLATVEAADEFEDPLSASDPSHYFGAEAEIDVEKLTNGVDADSAPGPAILVGSPVTWSYVVTNTGNDRLVNIVLSDDKVGTITCPLDSLDPLASMTCNANGVATLGQYANLARVTAHGTVNTSVTDSDPSHYLGFTSSIIIEKLTNGVDADAPHGPTIALGDTVTWLYLVGNSGSTVLNTVAVVDDQGLLPLFLGGDTGSDNLMSPGEIWVYAVQGTAVAGQYANLGSVSAVDEFQNPVSDNDPSHYFGADPGILVEKATNGEDADVAPGLLILEGDPVIWAYEVTNTGNDKLTGIELNDDQLGMVSCPATELEPQTSMICSANGVASRGQYGNLATVTAQGTLTSTVTDTDPSHYLGYISEVRVEKATNGVDADLPGGPSIAVGDTVTWTYVLSNPGDTALSSVALVDDQGVVPVFQGGDTNGDGKLDPDETWTYQVQGTSVAGQYANLATVTAEDEFGAPVTDTDPSHYFGSNPGIEVEKSTNGMDADAPPGPRIPEGNTVQWSYLVTNTGNDTLTGIALNDDIIGSISCPLTQLDPQGFMICTANGTATRGQYENLATVQGIDDTQTTVQDSDPSHYLGVLSDIHVEKSTNGDDADTPTGPAITVGDTVTWTYVVTNPGDNELNAV
ncbi:MAG: hypothetical protein DRQ40_10745, partial [Gammaproteobacteria bacterium]